ncbi:hypothetical protein VW29_18745, partial [Devosia limi DSM 17137]
MKLGLSSYSFLPLMRNGSMQLEDVFSWVRDHGGEHVALATFSVAPECAVFHYRLCHDSDALDRLHTASLTTCLHLSRFYISAHLIVKG